LIRESIKTQRDPSIISEAEERTFGLLVERHRTNAIRMEDFIGREGYSREGIERDHLSVESKKARIKEQGTEPTKRAQILEALLAEQIELSDWFGPSALTILPSEYDDLYNGVDTAIEFEDKDGFQYLAAGVDITSSAQAVQEKIAKIKKRIAEGKLTRIKYFESERNKDRKPGPLEQVPLLIIGTEGRTIRELSELWLTIHRTKLAKKDGGTVLSEESQANQRQITKEAQKKIAEHRIQIMLLEQIEKQLTVFMEYAKKIKKNEIAKKYEDLLELIREILKEKEITDEDQEKNEEDAVNAAIEETLMQFDSLPID